jgi:hypothetical protein
VPSLFLVAALTAQRAIGTDGRQPSPPTWVAPPPLITASDVTKEAIAHVAFPLLLFGHAAPCSALHQLLLCPPLPIADELPRAVQPGQKERLVTAPLLDKEPTRSTD